MLDSVPHTQPTRDRLIDAAATLMRRQSYSTVSVDEICRAADVKKGTFYHYFPSKVELALTAFDHIWAEGRVHVLAIFNDDALTVDEKLAGFCDYIVSCHRETYQAEGKVYGCPLSNAGAEMGAQDETIRQKMQDLFDEAVDIFATLAAKSPGHAGCTADECKTTARAMMCFSMGVEHQAKVMNNPDVIAQDLLHGLRRLISTPPTE